jgi:hypothetical protein
MKFKQYLTEETYTVKTALEMIYTHSTPFIKDLLKDGFNNKRYDELLYSGRHESRDMFVGAVRKNRRPVDTSQYQHELFDRLFYKKFGIKGRSQALFCTGNAGVARNYASGGSAYMIFPVGKYKFLWSHEVTDLYKNPYVDQIMEKYERLIGDTEITITQQKGLPPDEKRKQVEAVRPPLEKKRDVELTHDILSTYTTKMLMKAIDTRHEIMLDTDRYVAIKYDMYHLAIKSYIATMKTKPPTIENLEHWYNTYGKGTSIMRNMELY